MGRAVTLISVEGVAGRDGFVRRREFQARWAVEFRGVRIRVAGKRGGIRIVGERESGGGSFTLNGGDGGLDGRGMDVCEVERGRGRGFDRAVRERRLHD